MIDYLYGGMLLVSLVLIFFAIKQYSNSQKLISTGLKTKAKVIDLIEISGDDGYTYKPVFEYTDRVNNIITFNCEVSSSPARYKIGDIVNIVYDPNSDERKVISFWGLYRWTIILLTIASPLLIIGGGYILYTKG
ncbi:MAG: DUF3592 domain-containing protein [Bacteroidota bacterium]